MNEINDIDEINKIDITNKINKIYEMNKINGTWWRCSFAYWSSQVLGSRSASNSNEAKVFLLNLNQTALADVRRNILLQGVLQCSNPQLGDQLH